MAQQRSSLSVYHDLDKDRYFLIDKHTGQVIRSHKNGSLPKMFKADVTGNDYQIRKNMEKDLSQHHPRQILKLQDKINPSHLKRSVPLSSEKSILPIRLSPLKENQLLLEKVQLKGQERQNKSTNFRVKSEMSEQSENFVTGVDHQQLGIRKHHSNIGSLLNKFSKLKQLKVFQNHCHLQKESGTICNPKKLRNSKGFRQTKNYLHQPFSLVKSQTKKTLSKMYNNIELRQSLSKQLHKQKQLFLQFHPNFQPRQNVKLLKQQLERKKNMKSLEQLFLDETSRVTNQIYT